MATALESGREGALSHIPSEDSRSGTGWSWHKRVLVELEGGQTSSAGRGDDSHQGENTMPGWPAQNRGQPTPALSTLSCRVPGLCLQSTGFLLSTWPERRWAPSIVSTPSSECLEYLTCQPLLWIGGHGNWQRKQAFHPPLHHPG